MEDSSQGLYDRIYPVLRFDVGGGMRSPNDALAAAEVDIDNGAAALAGVFGCEIKRLEEVEK